MLNKNPLDYNHSIEDRLKQICAPLFNNFKITTFAYLKFLEDGKILHITTNHDWLTFYTKNNLFNDVNRYINEINNIPENGIGYYLRTSAVSNNFNEVLEKFGLWHGMSIYMRYPKYTESWCFATLSDNHQISDLYLNHMNILEHFILYFKSKAFDLISHSDKNKLLSTNAHSFELIANKPIDERIQNFFENTKIDTINLENLSTKFSISRRQAECIHHLAHGKSIKEIAKLLNLSPRTVESYIAIIKTKIGGSTKLDLLNFFSQLPDFVLLNNFHA
ncbi:MAG: helix-turn-helix transcriptional regulator [Alphaproteobacteria bacterium]|nr:helix-turn-helix transcriptional regulator [Alphaproteobacteria bacterium]